MTVRPHRYVDAIEAGATQDVLCIERWTQTSILSAFPPYGVMIVTTPPVNPFFDTMYVRRARPRPGSVRHVVSARECR